MSSNLQASERTSAALELLYEISREFASQLDLDALLAQILELNIDKIGAEFGSILILDDRGKVVEGALNREGEYRDHTLHQLAETFDKGLAGWVVRNREPALVGNTLEDERWLKREYELAQDIGKSAILVPIIEHDRVVGVITLIHSEENHFTEDDVDLLQAFADQAGLAIQNALFFKAEQGRRQFASTLQEIAKSINSSLDPSQVFPLVLDQLSRVIEYDSARIFVYEDDLLRLVAANGFDDDEVTEGITIPDDEESLMGQVLYRKRPLVIDDVQEVSGWVMSEDLKRSDEVRAWIGAPLLVRDQAVGLLTVSSSNPFTYGFLEVQVVDAFANQAATAVANAQLFSETQSARKRFTALFEDSIDPILITDLDGRLTDANVSAQNYLGHDALSLKDAQIEDLHHESSNENLPKFSEMEPGDAHSYVANLLHKAGGELPVEVHVKRMDVGDQPVLQWIMRDMSERQALDQLRADLTSMIFHDLRSPLGNIISSLEVMKTSIEEDDELLAPVISVAQRSSRRLSRLIDSLLDIGLLEKGKAVLFKTFIPLYVLLGEAVEEVIPTAEAKGHTLSIEDEKEIPKLEIDVDMIRRVLINLVENAVKFTPSGGKISIAIEDLGDRVQVRVKDTGAGIDAADQPRIFDKFARVERKGRTKGLGLGLAFCRLAIEAHGGEIWVESEPDHGSTFFFTLPV